MDEALEKRTAEPNNPKFDYVGSGALICAQQQLAC